MASMYAQEEFDDDDGFDLAEVDAGSAADDKGKPAEMAEVEDGRWHPDYTLPPATRTKIRCPTDRYQTFKPTPHQMHAYMHQMQQCSSSNKFQPGRIIRMGHKPPRPQDFSQTNYAMQMPMPVQPYSNMGMGRMRQPLPMPIRRARVPAGGM